MRLVGQPINLSRYPQPDVLGPTPDLGEHTAEVLTALGYGEADIKSLKARGIV
jgi:crotonobetainyl-CoA:carnitine CoA-transferase CaiB-like acyl-CoA transferase